MKSWLVGFFGSIVFRRFCPQVEHCLPPNVSSDSQDFAPGLRIGFASGPAPLIDAIDKHTSASNLQTSSTTQALTVAILEHYGYEGFRLHTEYVSQYYKEKRDVFERAMTKHLQGLAEWTSPEAGMFVWYVRYWIAVAYLTYLTIGLC